MGNKVKAKEGKKKIEGREEKRREGGLLANGIQNYIRHRNSLRVLKCNKTLRGDCYDTKIAFDGVGERLRQKMKMKNDKEKRRR